MLQCSKICSKEEEGIMSPTPKVNREPVMEEMGFKPDYGNTLAALFLHGVERMAEIQKQTIDFAMQQNAEMADALKKAAEKVPGVPRLTLLDLATGAVNRFADTQKAAIEFAVEQSQAWTDTLKDRAKCDKKAVDATTNMAKQAVERTFVVHKKALESTAAHTKAVVDAAKQQFGFTGTQAEAMTESFQKGVETIVEAQKELLDLVTH
jgi:hypothetical protein